MSKISRLCRAINYPTMPCCVQNNLEHLISDQSVFLSLASSNSLQLSLISQKHKLRSHKKSWRSSTDLYLLGFWIPVVPSCLCAAWSEYRFLVFCPERLCSLLFLREWRVSSSSPPSSASSSSTRVQRGLWPQIHRHLASGPRPLLFHKCTNSPKTTCWPPFRKWPRNGRCLLR